MRSTGSTLLLLLAGLICCLAQAPLTFDDVARENTYDYIVVGVGASGSVAATRLAESGRFQVLGIEGGKRSHRSLGGTDFVAAKFSYDRDGRVVYDLPWTRFDVPNFYPGLYNPPSPWEEYPAILNGEPIPFRGSMPGKHLGGAGAHNGMQWARFTKANFDSWGVRGWYFDDVLPFYKKTEDYTGTANAGNTYYHGLTGPIKIVDTPRGQYFESVTPFITACINTGLPNNTDFNGASRLGCGAAVYNIRRGVRDSSSNAYLPKALQRGNLHLSLESFVTRIIFEKEGGRPRAVGVEYVQFGEKKVVNARKEIVLTLGAVLTPKLLLLSGIGPASTLKKYKIPVVVDNINVGKNLSNNHLCLGGSWSYPTANTPNGFRVSDIAASYALNGTGPWSFPATFAVTYACSKTSCNDPDTYIAMTGGVFEGSTIGSTINFVVETHTPKGRGYITLSAADPFAPPDIELPIFQNPLDLDTIVYGLKLTRKIKNTYPATVTFGAELSPGPTIVTDAQLAAWARNNTEFSGHWVGSARVGNIGDPSAVLDPQMRVLGVRGLRVGDTSALVHGGAHTHASAIMTGERVAAFVLADS